VLEAIDTLANELQLTLKDPTLERLDAGEMKEKKEDRGMSSEKGRQRNASGSIRAI